MRLILSLLCLLCGVTVVLGALHNVTVLENRILVECNRYYDDVRLGKCTEDPASSWDSIDDQYPFELVKQAYDADGLAVEFYHPREEDGLRYLPEPGGNPFWIFDY